MDNFIRKSNNINKLFNKLKNKIHSFFEEMLFYPNWYHYFLIFLLLPFSLFYYLIILVKFPKTFEDLDIPIISVGNIVLGGSGKTPLTKAIIKEYSNKKIAVVMRGYKRKSKGLIVVKDFEKILVDVDKSGDEAMEIAFFTNAAVIVSEDRKIGILKAKEMGADFVILDDGFDKPFKKLNIVIDKKIKNPFLLPAGGYRYPRSFLKYADIILKDLTKDVKISNGDILISGISNPKRLLKFWNKEYKFFPDHYEYKWEDLKKYKNKIVVTTAKDYVKLKKFSLNIQIMELNVKIPYKVIKKIDDYLIKFQ